MLAAATDSLEVLLQFAFLAVLYLFLLWIVRSALRDMRRPATDPGEELAPFPGDERSRSSKVWLVATAGGGLEVGDAFEIGQGLTIGRSVDSALRIEDSYASGKHARVFERAGAVHLEDLRSTNGTYLNGERVEGEVELRPQDVIRIGDTEFRVEE
ncbi:MAG: FHA domain-containing protein [Solirubrobacterales bacterium]